VAGAGRRGSRAFSSDVLSYITGSGAAASGEAKEALSAAASLAHTGGIRGFLWPILALIFLAALFLIWLSTRGGPAVNTVAFNVADQVRLASQKATAALESLKPGYTANDLVSALNLGVINFATGSAEIPSDSDALLTKAAVAFQSAPAGTLIEIGGHTDNSGDPPANMQLSQQRADAVRADLVRQGVNPAMLVARGYGETKPVASNDTEEGQFRNRRIEFSAK
jgi:outer membrane protein OmpA-like peptidoglycan-associated protein